MSASACAAAVRASPERRAAISLIFMILDLHLIGSIRVIHYINKYLPQLQGDSPQTDEPKREENAPGFPANEQKKKKHKNVLDLIP